MRKNKIEEIIKQLKEFVFKKSLITFFLLTLITFFVISRFTDFRLENIFISDQIISLITSVFCLLSIIIARPLFAYSIAFTRKWPLKWYGIDILKLNLLIQKLPFFGLYTMQSNLFFSGSLHKN